MRTDQGPSPQTPRPRNITSFSCQRLSSISTLAIKGKQIFATGANSDRERRHKLLTRRRPSGETKQIHSPHQRNKTNPQRLRIAAQNKSTARNDCLNGGDAPAAGVPWSGWTRRRRPAPCPSSSPPPSSPAGARSAARRTATRIPTRIFLPAYAYIRAHTHNRMGYVSNLQVSQIQEKSGSQAAV